MTKVNYLIEKIYWQGYKLKYAYWNNVFAPVVIQENGHLTTIYTNVNKNKMIVALL